jgi:hypothetical protein
MDITCLDSVTGRYSDLMTHGAKVLAAADGEVIEAIDGKIVIKHSLPSHATAIVEDSRMWNPFDGI